ncbi:MAG: FAD-dependent monooxygenase [Pseudobacteriovorax sp.]|nr:FAD-dependent monooxygenase [Pseudobacteriovorax sp.]
MNLSGQHIVLAGGGLAGAFLSILLAQEGAEVTLYEKRPDPRQVEDLGKRSINLAISVRGLTALDRIESNFDWDKDLIPMRGRMIHGMDGHQQFQPYSPNPEFYINSVSRGSLNTNLLTLAEATGRVKVEFSSQVEAVDLASKKMTIKSERGNLEKSCERIIGVDGTASAVRKAIVASGDGQARTDFLNYDYKELHMPPNSKGHHAIEKEALHIWPRKKFMLIGLPNPDGSYTCTLFLPNKGDLSFDSLQSASETKLFFEEFFPNIPELIPDYLVQFASNPLGKLGTIHVRPWYFRDGAALVGDAAHGIVPFYGQGMNCAFESCGLLLDSIKREGSWEAAFKSYSESRMIDADAIAALAIRNFHEMQDHVADDRFLFRKSVLREIENRYDAFATEYSLVTFSNEPYSFAKRQGELQISLLDKITENHDTIDQIDWSKADLLVKDYLQNLA